MARRRSNRRRSSRGGGGGGNGIIGGIMIGMIVAMGAVAALMWYMNNQPNKFQQPQAEQRDPNDYQQAQRPTRPTTEIIRPQDNGVAPVSVETVPETPSVPENTVVNTPETDKTEKKEIAKKEEPKKANDDVLGEFIRKKDQEKQAEKAKKDNDALSDLITQIDQKNNKQPEKTPVAKNNTDDDDLGNLIGRIDQKKTPQKSVFKPVVEGKSVVQAGSFATREQAENQRAKLSMMGVTTHIETAVRDGKTYYRVRSGSIDTEQAYALKKRLADNQTDSIVIPYR